MSKEGERVGSQRGVRNEQHLVHLNQVFFEGLMMIIAIIISRVRVAQNCHFHINRKAIQSKGDSL